MTGLASSFWRAEFLPTYGSVVGGITLSWSSDRLIFQPPLAAVASANDTLVSVTIPAQTDPVYGSTVGSITLSWGTTNRLIFESPLTAVVSATDTLVSLNSSLYYTKTQTDAAIAAAIALALTPSTSPTFETVQGHAYIFSGSQSHTAAFNASTTFDPGTVLTDAAFSIGASAWTLAFYLKITFSNSYQSIFSRDPNSVQGGNQTFEMKTVGTDIYTQLGGDRPIWVLPYVTNTWYNFVLTWDGIDDAAGWVNGTLQALALDGSTGLNFTSATNFRVGAVPGGSNPLIGEVKNLKFWPRKLTATEIGAL